MRIALLSHRESKHCKVAYFLLGVIATDAMPGLICYKTFEIHKSQLFYTTKKLQSSSSDLSNISVLSRFVQSTTQSTGSFLNLLYLRVVLNTPGEIQPVLKFPSVQKIYTVFESDQVNINSN